MANKFSRVTFLRFLGDDPVRLYPKMKGCAEGFYGNKAGLFQLPDQFTPAEADYN